MGNNLTWYKLNDFRCPITDCKGAKTSYDWVCAADKGQMYIAQNGDLKCEGDRHYGQIITWRFDCGNHGDHPVDRYKKADLQGFTFALSYALQFTHTAGTDWTAALTTSLGKQYGRTGPK